MKKYFLISLMALSIVGATTSFTISRYEKMAAEEEVTVLVEKCYIHGAFNELDPEAMANGFHKDFAIFSADGEVLKRYEIESWVASVEKRKSDPEFDPENNVWDYKFSNVDVTGDAASLRVDLYRDNKHVYTDYLSLLKFDSGWKIVAKVYQKH